jgi:hypothetical protein
MTKAEEKTAARDFVMARLGAARACVGAASTEIDNALGCFVSPEDDKKGEERGGAMESAVDLLGEAVRAVEAAQDMLEDVDFSEGEPDLPEGDGEDPEEEEDEEED